MQKHRTEVLLAGDSDFWRFIAAGILERHVTINDLIVTGIRLSTF
jgi:hypothetical protein